MAKIEILELVAVFLGELFADGLMDMVAFGNSVVRAPDMTAGDPDFNPSRTF